MQRGSYYAVIPAKVRYDKSLPANAKLLYGEITALCNDKGYCWCTNNYFADIYDVSKKTISTWINTLAKHGYIQVEIVHKEGTKEIEERRIFISDTPIPKNVNTPTQKLPYPIPKNVKDNNTIEYTTNVVADVGENIKNFGIYHTIDDAIKYMKSDQTWKSMYGKQAGVAGIQDCDYWIDKYRDHAIASGKTSTSVKELKNHCLNWTRKRIQAGDKVPKVMTEAEKREARSKHFMTN